MSQIVTTIKSGSRYQSGERRYVVVFAACVMLASTLPYLIGYASQGEAYRFSGFVIGVEDGNSYIAKMLSGWAGSWLFRTPYTAFPQNGLIIFLPYLLLGKLAAPPGLHEQLVALFHLFRFGGGMLAILASYDLISRYVYDLRLRRLGLALVCLGGGLGWLLVLAGVTGWKGSLPLDFISPEAFGFLSLLSLPHLAMSRAMLVWALCAYLDLTAAVFKSQADSSSGKIYWRNVLWISFLWLLAGIFNPLALAIIGIVILAHLAGSLAFQLLQREKSHATWRGMIGHSVAAGVAPGGYLLYIIAVSRWDPFARIWMAQNQILSPNILHYLLAYGLIIPYAWVGGERLLKRNFRQAWLLIGWVIIVPILVYLPFNLQRRMTEGLWVALCILAMASFDQISASGKPSHVWRKILAFAPLSLAFITSLFLLYGAASTATRQTPPVFLPEQEAKVFQSLQGLSRASVVVIAAYPTSNVLPAWAPVSVLIGHGPESVYQGELQSRVAEFFQLQTNEIQRLELIDQFGIDYVLWGPAERQLGEWQPDTARYLRLFEQQGDYALYQFIGKQP